MMASLKLVSSEDQVSRDHAAAARIAAHERRRLMRDRMLWLAVIVAVPTAASGWYAWAVHPRIENRTDFIPVADDGTPIRALKFENLPPEAQADTTVSSVINYVAMRESYTFMTAESTFNRVQAMSSPPVKDEFVAYYRPNNPNSPFRIYGENGQVKFSYDSHEDLSPPQGYKGPPVGYMIRFCRLEIVDGKPVGRPAMFGATVRFDRNVAGIPARQRAEFNPGGIQVTQYPGARQISQESNISSRREKSCVIS